jgi:hypothetical protein
VRTTLAIAPAPINIVTRAALDMWTCDARDVEGTRAHAREGVRHQGEDRGARIAQLRAEAATHFLDARLLLSCYNQA